MALEAGSLPPAKLTLERVNSIRLTVFAEDVPIPDDATSWKEEELADDALTTRRALRL